MKIYENKIISLKIKTCYNFIDKLSKGCIMKTIKYFSLFLLIILLAGCNNTNINSNPPKEPNDSEQVDISITKINIFPEKNTASSGEIIKLNIEATMSSGEILDITNDATITSSIADFAIIEDNSIIVSDSALTADSFFINVEYKDFLEKVKIDIKNSLEDNIDPDGVITNASSYDAVINKERNLSSDYIPEDLVDLTVPTCLKNPEVNKLRRKTSDALTNLFESAKKEDLYLVARSGYRSYSTQTSLYNGYVSRHGQTEADKFSAKPGQSEHQTGLAIDITAESVSLQLADDFGETLEGKWVNENAHKYGFIIRYPKGKESITGYQFEPWHLRYLGITLATKVYESGLTLEEYFMDSTS